jgi:DtxR family transcriptional regulator, Mn-dependent transcriptional regulator
LSSQNNLLVVSKQYHTAFRVMPSSTVENYLKHILLLSKGAQDLVSMGEIAQALAIVPGTATTMIKALAREGYVAHQPRQGVSLTSSGRTVAA